MQKVTVTFFTSTISLYKIDKLVPVFIMAGFIEGFLTRHTQLPDMLRLGLILTSLTFILFYYIYLPNRKRHGITKA